MNYFSIDYLIVYAFLAITLIIGFKAGKGIKDIKEYALANRMFGTAALVLTWLATDVAGETILDMAGSVRTEGILQPLAIFGGWGIAMLMQALIFAPKVVHFHNCITMGDIMGELYKRPSQVITGILTFLTALCITGMELTVLGILFNSLLGINYQWAILIGGLILIGYTVHGGIKAVTYTDLFQFLVLLAVIPIITIITLQQAGGIKQIFMQVPATKFQIFDHPKFVHYFALFLSLSVFQFSVIDPALMQRMLMGRTKQQLRDQFFIVAAFLFALMLSLLMLGLASIVLFPTDPEMPIVPHIIHHLLPIGIKGLAAAGLLAITMSTFDSFLHAAGLTLVHDVISPLYNRKGQKLNELKWTRYVTVFIGFIAIAVALARAENLYGFVLISYQFTGPLLAFPLFAGILGLKPDRYAFYIASIATLAIFAIAKLLLPEKYAYIATLISVVSNGIIFLGIHVIKNKGFSTINRAKSEEYLWQPQHTI
jgi:SSS family solute:Na+ symporter